uniref:Keratocan n=2 Tax=Cyprinus carpio carpio TaxID=630221 RepID=A0A9J7Z1Z6_CYPCA
MSSTMLNLTMEWLMVAFVALLLASQVHSEEILYEHLISQIQACPKECHCPPSFPNAVYCDNKGLKRIPYFKGLPKVMSLRLNRNKLANGGIPKNVFNLSSILDLQLSHNLLTEIPVISSGLEHLHLDHNKIKSVNSSDICPPGALDDYFDEKGPRLRYLRLDGNEIKPPIPRELMMCFRLLRAIVI